MLLRVYFAAPFGNPPAWRTAGLFAEGQVAIRLFIAKAKPSLESLMVFVSCCPSAASVVSVSVTCGLSNSDWIVARGARCTHCSVPTP